MQLDYKNDIIRKYLSNMIGEEKALETMARENLSNIAYSLGKRSIEFFCLYFLQDVFVPKADNRARKLAPVHFQVWKELESQFIRDEYDKLVLALPRGLAKSTIVTYALAIWAHCYKESVYTIVQGKTEGDSVEFVGQVRQALEENELVKSCFGELIDQKANTVNKLELELTNGTKIQALSSTSSIRGKKYNNRRPSLIISDDAQGQNDILTEEARFKKHKTYIEDTEYAGDKAVYRDGVKVQKATKFIVLGTILHSDCFISRMLKNQEYKHIVKAVVNFDVDEKFNNGLWAHYKKWYFDPNIKNGKEMAHIFYMENKSAMDFTTLWSDKYLPEELAISYYTNARAFKQEMMNDAKNLGVSWFKTIVTQSRKEIESRKFVRTMLCADPSSTSNRRSDYTAFCVGSMDENGFKYVRAGHLEKINARTDFDVYIKRMVRYLLEYKDITHVYIEGNTFQGVDAGKLEQAINKNPELLARNIQINNDKQRKNKDDKIATIISAVNNGQVIFCEDDEEFIMQVKDFSGQDFTSHDDAPDILAECCIRLDSIKTNMFVTVMDRRVLGV